jgi:hypothetical protein
MTFYVYESAFWTNRTRIRKIVETEAHVFAASAASLNPFSSGVDRSVFGALLREASSDSFIRNMIRFPAGTKILTNNVVRIRDRDLPSPSMRIGNIVYIPVRDVAVELGYQVIWDAPTRTIMLRQGVRFEYIMQTSPISVRQSLDAVIIDDRAYASTIFFTQILRVNVEIDEYNNVYIIE